MTKRRKLMPPLPPSTLLASTLSNPMVCCFNLCLTFKVLFYCIHLRCLFSQSLLPRVASTSVASRVKPLPLLSSPRIYTRTIFLTFSALETCTPTSSFLFIYFFFCVHCYRWASSSWPSFILSLPASRDFRIVRFKERLPSSSQHIIIIVFLPNIHKRGATALFRPFISAPPPFPFQPWQSHTRIKSFH